jgi:glycerophosphoryl diester phosphodiesterase
MKHFDLQGHRGCRGLMPENTIPAMIKAIDLGVTTIEMDVVITKDLQVLVSHEPFFSHEITTKPNGGLVTKAEEKLLNIYKMDYDEVKKYDVGMKRHPRFPGQEKIKAVKPLLSELIDNTEAYSVTKKLKPVRYNIEIKSDPATDDTYHPKPEVFVDLLIKTIEAKSIHERVTIQSFDIRPLQYLHERYPAYTVALLIEIDNKQHFDEQLNELGFIPPIYSPEKTLVNRGLVNACHKKGIKIIPWTVNEPERFKELIMIEVDGIITDYPNLYFDLFNN